MSSKIVLYFDCVSPWSYIAFQVLRRYRATWGVQLEFQPRSLAYVMKFSQNSPPITVPNKGAHMMNQLSSVDRMYGLKLRFPASFPFDTFPVMGLLRTVQAECPDRLEEMIEASFQYIWRDGHSVKSEEDLKDLASRCFQGDQLSSLIKKAYARDTRALLKAESEQLVENGAFGFPFGVEQLERLAAFLHKPYLGPMADGTTPRL
ncbi:dsba oxidoreductase [Malassezia pachydermatis]|uniref:Dsba oxidoreductase n=1 Tax=Malassezia pachydermatis TaxID=77020 RepID=A0A0M9VRG1_9BASI|nr:dsba oxidoreductase [Malassezia pachydermatis]KOS16589.1 dsba oxidoreductase [Malassezia pachydermatis]